MSAVIKTRQRRDSGYVQHGSTRYPTTYVIEDRINTSWSPYPPGNSPWRNESWYARGSRINGGPDRDGNNLYVNVPSVSIANRNFPTIQEPDDVPSSNWAATKLLADTNPNTPYVDIPAFIRELPEMAQLLRIEGTKLIEHWKKGTFSKFLAQGNLEYQFGWRPFVSDIVKLVTFQGAVKARADLLREMQTKGYKSFKRTLYKGARQSSYLGGNLPTDVQVWEGYTVHMWGYVVWYPDGDIFGTEEQLHLKAERAALGLNLSFASAWETMPWSWLIDWCTNIGTYLNSTRNFIPMRHSVPLIMVHKKRQAQHAAGTFWEDRKWSVSDGVFTHEIKERFPVPSTYPEAKLPFLTDGQFSILASIGVLGRKGKGLLD